MINGTTEIQTTIPSQDVEEEVKEQSSPPLRPSTPILPGTTKEIFGLYSTLVNPNEITSGFRDARGDPTWDLVSRIHLLEKVHDQCKAQPSIRNACTVLKNNIVFLSNSVLSRIDTLRKEILGGRKDSLDGNAFLPETAPFDDRCFQRLETKAGEWDLLEFACINKKFKARYLDNSDEVDVITELIACGVNVNTLDSAGYSILHKTKNLTTEAVQELLWHRANPNLPGGEFGTSPLCHVHTLEMAQLLVTNGAKADQKDLVGRIPLHFVKQADIAEFLLSQDGVHPDAVDNMGRTLLDFKPPAEVRVVIERAIAARAEKQASESAKI